MDTTQADVKKRPGTLRAVWILGFIILIAGAVVKWFPHEVQAALDYIFGV